MVTDRGVSLFRAICIYINRLKFGLEGSMLLSNFVEQSQRMTQLLPHIPGVLSVINFADSRHEWHPSI